jgi:hypothetical protein
MTNWVRLWEDMPTDPKWRVIARKADASISEVIAVFTFMLVNAADPEHRGVLKNWSDEDVAEALGMQPNAIERIRTHMNAKVLDGDKLMGWERRQPKREDGSADRARKWREAQKQKVDENERNRTQSNASERPETETDISSSLRSEDRPKKSKSSNASDEAEVFGILSECVSEQTARDVIKHRKKLKSELTPGAARGLVKEWRKHGSCEAAASAQMANGWKGFNAEWMQKQPARGSPPKQGGGVAHLFIETQNRIAENEPARTQIGSSETSSLLPVNARLDGRSDSADDSGFSRPDIEILVGSAIRRM